MIKDGDKEILDANILEPQLLESVLDEFCRFCASVSPSASVTQRGHEFDVAFKAVRLICSGYGALSKC